MWPRVYCETGIFWPCDSSVLCGCAALEENKTWDQLSPDCGWKPFIWISVPGEPLGAAHRHEAISLVWWIPSITALTQNCWLQPHTERASKTFLGRGVQMSPIPFFPQLELSVCRLGLGHYYPKHRLSLDYYHPPLTLQLLPGSHLWPTNRQPADQLHPVSQQLLRACPTLGHPSFDSKAPEYVW